MNSNFISLFLFLTSCSVPIETPAVDFGLQSEGTFVGCPCSNLVDYDGTIRSSYIMLKENPPCIGGEKVFGEQLKENFRLLQLTQIRDQEIIIDSSWGAYNERCYFYNQTLHNDRGPAVISTISGKNFKKRYEAWYLNGKLQKEDGKIQNVY